MIRFKFDWTILIIIYLKFRFKIYGIDLLKIPKSAQTLKNTNFICVIFYIKQLVNFYKISKTKHYKEDSCFTARQC